MLIVWPAEDGGFVFVLFFHDGWWYETGGRMGPAAGVDLALPRDCQESGPAPMWLGLL